MTAASLDSVILKNQHFCIKLYPVYGPGTTGHPLKFKGRTRRDPADIAMWTPGYPDISTPQDALCSLTGTKRPHKLADRTIKAVAQHSHTRK